MYKDCAANQISSPYGLSLLLRVSSLTKLYKFMRKDNQALIGKFGCCALKLLTRLAFIWSSIFSSYTWCLWVDLRVVIGCFLGLILQTQFTCALTSLYYIYSLILLRRESDSSSSVEKSLLRRLNGFLGLVGLACVALSDIVEDAKASWSWLLLIAHGILSFREHRLVVGIGHKPAHEGRSDLLMDHDVPNLEAWLRNQVFFFAGEAIIRCVSFLLLVWNHSEQAVSNFTWRDLLSANFLIASLTNVVVKTVDHLVDV